MRFLVKVLLVLTLAVLAILDYRVFTFDNGITQFEMQGDFLTTVKTLSEVEEVEYYERKFPYVFTDLSEEDGKMYSVFIKTTKGAYLLTATEKEFKALDTVGTIAKKITPKENKPVPFIVEAILGLVILIIPFKRKKAKA